MRIKISFANQKSPTFIPINTNYYIVKLINSLNYEYQKYLNALIPGNPSNNNFDIFTFSQLIIPLRKIEKFKIEILSEKFYLYISSPFYQFLSILSKELFKRKSIKLLGHWFDVIDVDFYASPQFDNSEAQFTCLSPVTVYRDKHKKNKKKRFLQYMFPNEKDYYSYLEKDLLHKYNLINNENRSHINLQLEFDAEYIRRKKNRITKIITLENQKVAPNQVRGVLAPLKIKAEPEILKLIYDAGLGRLNYLGFGMVESVHPVRMA